MAEPETEKKKSGAGKAPPVKAKAMTFEDDPIQFTLNALAEAPFKELAKVRADLDSGIPKLSSLSLLQRQELGLRTSWIALRFSGRQKRLEAGPGLTFKEVDAPPDPGFVGLNSLGLLLSRGPEKASPKQYEAAVKELWEKTKAALDAASKKSTIPVPTLKKNP